MATIEVAREDFGDPTDTKPVTCFCTLVGIRTLNQSCDLLSDERVGTVWPLLWANVYVWTIGIEPISFGLQPNAKPS